MNVFLPVEKIINRGGGVVPPPVIQVQNYCIVLQA